MLNGVHLYCCDVLLQGLSFIYKFIKPEGHGLLTSRNCYIDKQWFLKIYMHSPLHAKKILVEPSELLWTAPELLRKWVTGTQTYHDLSSTSKEGDVYSFGILLQEILSRSKPFFVVPNDVEGGHILRRM